MKFKDIYFRVEDDIQIEERVILVAKSISHRSHFEEFRFCERCKRWINDHSAETATEKLTTGELVETFCNCEVVDLYISDSLVITVETA